MLRKDECKKIERNHMKEEGKVFSLSLSLSLSLCGVFFSVYKGCQQVILVYFGLNTFLVDEL